jgi:hypothetical protein
MHAISRAIRTRGSFMWSASKCERAADFRFLYLHRRRNHWVRANPLVRVDENKSAKHPLSPLSYNRSGW